MKKFILLLGLLTMASCSGMSEATRLREEVQALNTNLRDIKTELEKLRKTLIQLALSVGAKPEDFEKSK